MNISNIDKEYGIYGMLFSLSNRIQTIGDKDFKDITMKQLFLMIALDMMGEPPTLKEMGEVIGCSYQNVKRMADHLQKEQYLSIDKDGSDKRKLLLKPAPKFKKLAQEHKERSVEFMEALFQDIPKEDLDVTLKTLKKMDKNIGGVIE